MRPYIISALIWWPICYGWFRIGRRRGWEARQREVVQVLEDHK